MTEKQLWKKQTGNLISVFYPLVCYYLLSSFAFFGMTLFVGEAEESYMLKQLVSSGVTIPYLLALKKQDAYTEEVVYGKRKKLSFGQAALLGSVSFFTMAAFGIALNNMIAMTGLIERSDTFQSVNQAFFGGGIFVELLASCVVVPIAEELLFRCIVLKRCCLLAGKRMGIFFSALLFGVIHMNLVQFIYASLLGILLAVFAVWTKRVWVAVFGHAAANLFAVLRAETGMLAFSYEADFAGIGFSVLLLLMGSAAAWFCWKWFARQEDKEEEKSQSYPLFLQWDARWGYEAYGDSNLALSGCGPTVLAMAAVALTKDTTVTPDKVAAYSMEHNFYVEGTGTAWALMTEGAKEFGLEVLEICLDEAVMKKALDKGEVIICSMRAGDFTTAGHFVMIYAYDEQGFLINDPNCIYRSCKYWSYQELSPQIRMLWSAKKQ